MVLEGCRIFPGDALHGAHGIAVHPVFLRVGVEVVVERPSLEVGRFDDHRVTFPVPDRIAIEHGFQTLAVGTSIKGNQPGHGLEFMGYHEKIFVLNEAHGVGGQHSGREACGQAEVAGLIVAHVAGAGFDE